MTDDQMEALAQRVDAGYAYLLKTFGRAAVLGINTDTLNVDDEDDCPFAQISKMRYYLAREKYGLTVEEGRRLGFTDGRSTYLDALTTLWKEKIQMLQAAERRFVMAGTTKAAA